MSHSLLNIQQISSRTFHNQSHMDNSVDPQRHNTSIVVNMQRPNRGQLSNPQELIRLQQEEFDKFRRDFSDTNQPASSDLKGSRMVSHYEQQVSELMEILSRANGQNIQIQQKYHNAIRDLKQTLHKNQLLHQQIDRLKRKVNKIEEYELNYSNDIQQSQHIISSLSKDKSNCQIQMVNMMDSIMILEKKKKEVQEANDEYEEKLALVSQEIQRLRGMLDQVRRENERLKIGNRDLQQQLKRNEGQHLQGRPIMDRLRIQIRQLKNNNTSLSSQLQEYHQKLLFKQRQLNDLQERQHQNIMIIKTKQSQLRQLQAKTQTLMRSTRNIQQESSFRDQGIKQQIGRLQIALRQVIEDRGNIQIQRDQVLRRHEEFMVKFDVLKKDYQMISKQKEVIIRDIESISVDKERLLGEKEQFLKERQRWSYQVDRLKDELKGTEGKWKQNNMEKSQQLENAIRHFESSEKGNRRQYDAKIQAIQQQKNRQLIALTSEISQYKLQINSLKNHLDNFKAQIAARNSEINQLKKSTMSQSTLIDTTRRDCQQKLREKNQHLHQMHAEIQLLSRTLEKTKNDREKVLEDKIKEMNNINQRCEVIAQENQELHREIESKGKDIQNYLHIINKNDSALQEMNRQLQQTESRVLNLTHELERIASILREKDLTINEMNSRHRQMSNTLEEKRTQIINLRDAHDKINISLNRSEESKGNFQIFLTQIERLNEIIMNKQSQIKNLRLQINKVIQKIEMVFQQQIKIIKIIQNTYIDDTKRNIELNDQLSDLKEYIGKLNQTTNFTLQDIYQQGTHVTNYLNTNQHNFKLQVQDQNTHYQTIIAQKQQEILTLQREIDQLRLKEKEQIKQEQIFQKLVQLTQENAAIVEQLNLNKSQFQSEIDLKNHSIIQLESRLKENDKIQKKELHQLKQYINQRQIALVQASEEVKRVREEALQREGDLDRVARQLRAENGQLQERLRGVAKTIDEKLRQIERTSEGMFSSNHQIQKYKTTIKRYQQQLQRHHHQQIDQDRFSAQQKEIEKLQKILEIRNIQIANNEESYFNLKGKLQTTEHQFYLFKAQVKKMKINQSSPINQSQPSQIYKLEQEGLNFREVADLKDKNYQLQRELRLLQNKLKESEHKLEHSKQQIVKQQTQLQKFIDKTSKSIQHFQTYQLQDSQRDQLYQKIHSLEDELDDVTIHLREIQIDYNFIKGNDYQNKINLHAYQNKNVQLERQYLKLKQILANLNNQNSNLHTKNHYFEIQLKKAQILQQKIQVLNSQINRLSFQNINLNEEMTTVKLALSGESVVQRKTQEHLGLIVILFAEIQSLRSRLKGSEQELKNSRSQILSSYRC